MNDRTEVAIVAAMEREIAPLVRGWEMILGPRYHYYERGNVIVVCGGIGQKCARNAAESVLTFRQPAVVISAGLAGSLRRDLPVGTLIVPTKVLRPDSDLEVTIEGGAGTLLSIDSVASPAAKQQFAGKYKADAVDMEAAAVAAVARGKGARFLAIKAISDELGFEMPAMDAFIGPNGEFHTARFALHTVVRPGTWPLVRKLQRNTNKAVQVLCDALAKIGRADDVDQFLRVARAS